MKAAFFALLSLGLSACSVLQPTYPIEAVVWDGSYRGRSIFESDGDWVVTKHFDSDIFYFTLRKTEAADLELDNQQFVLSAGSAGYDVSLYPTSAKFGQRVGLIVRNKPGMPPPPPEQRFVYVLVSYTEKGKGRTRSIRFFINDLTARR